MLHSQDTLAGLPGSVKHSASTEPNTEPDVDTLATTIQFSETQFDFGTIQQGDVVRHGFEFMNTGTVPLIIQSAKASCGCTVPSYPKEPIAPGAKGVVQVQFTTAGKQGLQNKNITVSSNANPPVSVLNINANVLPK